MLEIYKNSAFSLMKLTKAINEIPFVPGQIGKMGIFAEEGVSTTTVAIEKEAGRLVLVPTSKRGTAPTPMSRDNRSLRTFFVPRKALSDNITADEIQNKRSFGSDNQLQTAQNEVAKRQQKMVKSLDATVEYGRMGALRGQILDADGTTVEYNLYNEFGVNEITVDLVLGTDTTKMVVKAQSDIRGQIEDELGGDGDESTEIAALLGSTMWNNFISHPNVKAAYQDYLRVLGLQGIDPLTMDTRYKGFRFGGVTWRQYRGKVGAVNFIPATEGRAFPTNVPDLYQTYFAPADYIETVNTDGLPRYSKMAPDPSGFDRNVQLESQTNPLSINTRPRTSLKLTTSN